MEIDYLEPNKEEKKNNKSEGIKKVSEFAQIYAVVTQGFIMMVVVALSGFLIGRYAIKQDIWAAILGVIGGLIGLVIFIMLLMKLKIGGEKNGKSEQSDE